MSAQDEREWSILNSVYNTLEGVFTKTERPDFLIKRKSKVFGVEITEFYQRQSIARVQNISGYLEEILDEGKYRHKDDKSDLVLNHVPNELADNLAKYLGLVNADGFKGMGIFSRVPTVNEYMAALGKDITKKEGKYSTYETHLSHINLIIYDAESSLQFVVPEKIHFAIYSQIEDLVRVSSFNEIYLITELKLQEEFEPFIIPLVRNMVYRDIGVAKLLAKQASDDFVSFNFSDFILNYFQILYPSGIIFEYKSGILFRYKDYGIHIVEDEIELLEIVDDRRVTKDMIEITKNLNKQYKEFVLYHEKTVKLSNLTGPVQTVRFHSR